MSDQLKNATAAAHQSLEAFLIPLIKQSCTTAEYAKLLRMFWGYYKPLEEAIDRYGMQELLTDYDQRRKAGLILQDLEDLGEAEEPPLAVHVPSIRTQAEAIGALYVLEGSTLGGQIITKILQRNLHTESGNGFRFFYGYGSETAARWKRFQEVLGGFCSDPARYREVEQAAQQTFIQLKTWAETCYRYERTKEKL